MCSHTLMYRYNAFLASDSLIKQIPRLLGPALTKVRPFILSPRPTAAMPPPVNNNFIIIIFMED
jgi:hypothetical protein